MIGRRAHLLNGWRHLVTSLRTSVDAHRPIPQGTVGQAFQQWGKRTLTPEELQRMRKIDSTYMRTAVSSGALTTAKPSGF
jgi:hypothetical protein